MFCLLPPGLGAADIDDAIAALQRHDFALAERKLRVLTAAHPTDGFAFSLLAAALDNQNKASEADTFHRRAVALAPRSLDVLNNYAVHLWMSGNQPEARKTYLRILAIDPANANANLQSAQFAIKDGHGAEALRYLDRLPESPPAMLLRLAGLYMDGATAEGDALAAHLSDMAKGNAEMTVALATTLWNAHRFDQAETAFEEALKGDPANFNILYDLGVAAARAGHPARAAEALETALRQQPRNIEVLLALAQAEESLQRLEPALELLAQAARLDPKRPDVQKLIAVTAAELGALDDALSAWDRFLKLVPGDEAAARERAYTIARMGKVDEALAIVEPLVARRPDDATGHYELGQIQRTLDVGKALAQFDRALALDPKFVPALTARGSLYYQEGKPDLAVRDLELAASLTPGEAANLDRLGQAYQALDKTADAVRVLRKAAELAPTDSRILLHFGRALADAGDTAESKAVMDRFRQLGPEKKTGVPPGFVEYLSLSPEERRASYRARVEKAVHEHPDDAAVQLAWMKVLLEDRHLSQASDAMRLIERLKPPPAVLGEAELDLAVALLQSGQPSEALSELQKVPATNRAGDYLIAFAEAFNALGRESEWEAAMGKALADADIQPDVYRRAAGMLIAKGRTSDAARILDRAPQDRSVLLMKACLGGNTEAFLHIQNRWPEWYPGWAAQGILLVEHGQFKEARKPLETAVALGAREPEVYFYLAWCQTQLGLPAHSSIARAMALSGDNPDQWIQTLAQGRFEKPPYLARLMAGSLF